MLTQIDGVILNVHILQLEPTSTLKDRAGFVYFVSLLRFNLIRCRNIRVCSRRLNRVFDAQSVLQVFSTFFKDMEKVK